MDACLSWGHLPLARCRLSASAPVALLAEVLRYHHENEVVEFKKAENSFDFNELGKYFSALSNEANLRDKDFAWLVFGVHDKTREILGTSYKNGMKSLQKLKYDLSQHTTDRNTFRDIYELEVEGKRVLMFQIPAAPRGIPTAWQGISMPDEARVWWLST